MILGLIEQVDVRVIGLWGMGGIGKTTLADAVYKEVFPKYECRLFLQNISEKIKKQGNESLRNELLSKLLNEKEICIDTPSIGYPYQERLNNKKVLLVLDNVSDPDQIDFMGVTYFGPGSKIIVTSRDRQVLKNRRAHRIYKVKELNENDSLQLFSTFAFKLLNPVVDFRDLSCKFVEYVQGSPLALKVLGSELYTMSKLKISHILKSSLDELDEEENNIFLDLACIFKGQAMDYVEKVLSNCYKGATCGISKLVDKCLLENKYGCVFMHDMVEEMGKDIVMRKSECPGKRSRLWSCEDMEEVFKYDKVTEFFKGIKLDVTQTGNQQFCATGFEKMHKLRYINIRYFAHTLWEPPPQYANKVDSISLPFKTLSSFNSKNLVVLILRRGNMEQLWNEDDRMDLVNLRQIDVSWCANLMKIHNLSGAINLELLDCSLCKSLVELPCLNHLASLHHDKLHLEGCYRLKKFPQVPRHFCSLGLEITEIEEVPDSIEHLHKLQRLSLSKSEVKKVSINISKLELPGELILSNCPMIKFPEIPKSLTNLNLSRTQIEEVSLPFDSLCNLQDLNISGSAGKNVSIKLDSLRKLNLSECSMIKFPEIPRSLIELNLSGTQIEEVSLPSTLYVIFRS
ncbi:hypothetical protein GOBAR_DD25208 [Gossypium barbadense]|nr:hypothetical protein GOBAR_DD25208 [Gossypium barbadense]